MMINVDFCSCCTHVMCCVDVSMFCPSLELFRTSSINVVSFVSSESQEITHGTMQEQNIFHCVCWKNNSWNTPIIPYYKINTPIQWSHVEIPHEKPYGFVEWGVWNTYWMGMGFALFMTSPVEFRAWSGRTSCARFGSWDEPWEQKKIWPHDGSVCMPYMICHLPSVYPSHVSIYIYIIDGSVMGTLHGDIPRKSPWSMSSSW